MATVGAMMAAAIIKGGVKFHKHCLRYGQHVQLRKGGSSPFSFGPEMARALGSELGHAKKETAMSVSSSWC